MPHDLCQGLADDGRLLRLTGLRLKVGVKMLIKFFGTVGHTLCMLVVKYFWSAHVSPANALQSYIIA